MEVRQGANARDVKGYDTERLRNDFLIQNLFPADDFKLVYSQIDRIIVGGCMPVNKELTLEAGSELKAAYFLERREMGIFNVGGNGSVIVDGTEYKFKYRDGLYIGMGSKEIKFKSEDSSKPAKFYFNSTPAHKTYPTVFIDPEKDIKDEFKLQLGSVEGLQLLSQEAYGIQCHVIHMTDEWKFISTLRFQKKISLFTTWVSQQRLVISS